MMDIKIQVSKLERIYNFDLNGWKFFCRVLNTEEDGKVPIEVLEADLRGIVATLERMIGEVKSPPSKVTLDEVLYPNDDKTA